MTDQSAETSSGPESPAAPRPDTAAPASSRTKWTIMFFVLLLITIVLAVYFLNKIRALETDLLAAGETQQSGNETLNARINTLGNTLAEIQTQHESMAASIAGLYEQQPVSNEDWALAETEYLLTLALHQLQLAGDVQSARRTMEAAALRLQGITDADLEPVRQQLAADIDQLNTLNAVDITGFSIYLADLIDRAGTLPLKKSVIEKEENPEIPAEAVPAESGAGLQHMGSELWKAIKSLVVIKRGAETRQVLLPPQQEYFLYQNLRLELENARLSVIRKDTENLRTSVNLLKDWLQEFYDTQDSAVVNVLETLDMMASVELQPELPDISSSLESLRAVQRGHVSSDQSPPP